LNTLFTILRRLAVAAGLMVAVLAINFTLIHAAPRRSGQRHRW
jgi:ABC-type microcin C transport system permease subunit YejB